ncbi:hypothetical protein BD289DRAFT_179723 [Coniella lustricola]|uniref:Secreted protein n=1 Tax=Coniella lustricola TaxID=2025994 RepID=A0A2T2ZTG5_9PEZI|nr:hypothetical protein BD289DRAFT_179723 [Coniella lustricola]
MSSGNTSRLLRMLLRLRCGCCGASCLSRSQALSFLPVSTVSRPAPFVSACHLLCHAGETPWAAGTDSNRTRDEVPWGSDKALVRWINTTRLSRSLDRSLAATITMHPQSSCDWPPAALSPASTVARNESLWSVALCYRPSASVTRPHPLAVAAKFCPWPRLQLRFQLNLPAKQAAGFCIARKALPNGDLQYAAKSEHFLEVKGRLSGQLMKTATCSFYTASFPRPPGSAKHRHSALEQRSSARQPCRLFKVVQPSQPGLDMSGRAYG